LNPRFKLRNSDSSSKGIATVVVVLVVIVIILLAGVAYLAVAPGKTVSSTLTTTSVATSTVSSVVTSTQTTTSIFSNPLLLYSADSQVNESNHLEAAFTAATGIPMATPVSAGSGALAADIAAGDPVSVFLSISHSSVSQGDLGNKSFAGWAIAFAGDQFDIAYSPATNQSSAGQAVLASYATAESTNSTSAWYDFFNNLTSGAVKVGISNPVADPAGYRGWLALELAGIAYAGGMSGEQYFVNRTLTNDVNVTGASAAALVPALESGQIQFLFYYRSAIVSGGLGLIQLATPVDLGVGADNNFYGQANYTVSPGDIETASAITLWITVPADSTDVGDSVSFVVFVMLNDASVLKPFDLNFFSPAHLYNSTGYTVPAPIVQLLSNGTLTDEGPVGS
jgi:molybdate/tungstate transport system substrate-binding protein